MANKTLFQRIVDREISAQIVFEDELCIALRDINPQAPVHILVVPKKPIPSTDEITAEDGPLVGHLYRVMAQLAKSEKLAGGYRVVVNCGSDAGQTVAHLHFHLLGGRTLGWPPG